MPVKALWVQGSCLGLYITSTQAPVRPVADPDPHQTVVAPLSPGSLFSLKERNLFQTSFGAEVALPSPLTTTLGTPLAGPHTCFAWAGAAPSLHAGPWPWPL